MENKEYERVKKFVSNGWTNYETWRINLEYFDCMELDTPVGADYLKENLDEFIEEMCPDLFVAGLARAFVSQVNFKEIADSLNDKQLMLNEKWDLTTEE